jgi:hypothetical protein
VVEIASPNRDERRRGAADHSVGFHENQDFAPAGPTLAESRPEESVHGVQCWTQPFPFQHGDLLSEGEDFESGIATAAKEDAYGDKEREDDFEHDLTLLARRNVASRGRTEKSQVADFKPPWAFVY